MYKLTIVFVLSLVVLGCSTTTNVYQLAPDAEADAPLDVPLDGAIDIGPDGTADTLTTNPPIDSSALDSAIDSAPCDAVDPLVACRYPSCGDLPDGCGGVLHCGDKCSTVNAYDSCGGGGTPNKCGCTIPTCAEECINGVACGFAADCDVCFGDCRPGGTLDGGTCPSSDDRVVTCGPGKTAGEVSPRCTFVGRDSTSSTWCCPHNWP